MEFLHTSSDIVNFYDQRRITNQPHREVKNLPLTLKERPCSVITFVKVFNPSSIISIELFCQPSKRRLLPFSLMHHADLDRHFVLGQACFHPDQPIY